MASCVLKHGKFLRVNYNWTSFQAFDAPTTAGSIQLNSVIPHRFATDRVETRHDIAHTRNAYLVCFVQLLGLGLQDILHPGSLWRNKRQTHYTPPAWWTIPSHLKPVSTDIYLIPWSTTGPSLLIKLTSLLVSTFAYYKWSKTGGEKGSGLG